VRLEIDDPDEDRAGQGDPAELVDRALDVVEVLEGGVADHEVDAAAGERRQIEVAAAGVAQALAATLERPLELVPQVDLVERARGLAQTVAKGGVKLEGRAARERVGVEREVAPCAPGEEDQAGAEVVAGAELEHGAAPDRRAARLVAVERAAEPGRDGEIVIERARDLGRREPARPLVALDRMARLVEGEHREAGEMPAEVSPAAGAGVRGRGPAEGPGARTGLTSRGCRPLHR
jgi:hypothetical protein